MGCGGSSAAAAQVPRPPAQSSHGVGLAPGKSAVIRNYSNARLNLNGERVILQELNDIGEWTVKGDKFPLSMGMSLGAKFLEVDQPAPTLLSGGSCVQHKAHTCPSGHILESNGAELVPGQCVIIQNCPNVSLNGQQVICEELNDLGEWTVKGEKFPLTIGMSLGAQFLQPAPTVLSGDKCVSSQASMKCRNGHDLVWYDTSRSRFRTHSCNRCSREGIAAPEHIYRCQLCNFDICQACGDNARRLLLSPRRCNP